MDNYWTHNVSYHRWILKRIQPGSIVLDVGCGDGLLAQKLAGCCQRVYGVEPHGPSAALARERTASLPNVQIHATTFDAFPGEAGSMDAVIFVASLHHMDFQRALGRAKALLAPGGIGVPTMPPAMSLRQIRCALPDANIRQGLYDRYLLRWEKP